MILIYYKIKVLRELLYLNDNKQVLLIKGEQNWHHGLQEDYTDLAPEIKKIIIPKNEYSKYVGFIVNFKKEYNIFKVKNMSDS